MLRQIWGKMDIGTCDKLIRLEADADLLEPEVYFGARRDILSRDRFIKFAWNMAAEEKRDEKKV